MITKTGTMDAFPGRGPEGERTGALVLLYTKGLGEPESDIPAATAVRNSLVIGREPPPGGLRIPNPAASRIHARIERRGDGFRVIDLDSRNGVLLNGRFVRDEALAHRDVLRIGDAIFTFVEEDAALYAPYRIDGAVAADALPVIAPALVGGYQIRALARELASVAPSSLSVLVLGETGTGKEVAARAVHDLSGRSGPFVAINCAAVPAQLLESELFGFRKGAFTGANRDHLGLVRSADGGTLFLDEIGDMPLEAQAKLLRLLEAREVVPLGATQATRVDVRVVSATHRDLSALVARGTFRGDLLARVQGYSVVLPPLRHRKEDLYPLVRHFLAVNGAPHVQITLSFMVAMCHYDWPFNVRELAQAVHRAVVVSGGQPLEDAHLPRAIREKMTTYGERAPRSDKTDQPTPERRGPPGEAELRAALEAENGNVAAVARRYNRDRRQIHRWLRLYGITAKDFREP